MSPPVLRVVQPRDPHRPPDRIVPQRIPNAPLPFGNELPDEEALDAALDMSLAPFDDPTENTPVTAVSPWQRLAPPPFPMPESTPESEPEPVSDANSDDLEDA